MRKILSGLFIVLCNSGVCHAAPCYGTRMPGKREFSIGFQDYSILKRPLQDDRGEIKSFQHFLLLSFGIFDWLSLDLKGGAGNVYHHRHANGDDIKYPAFLSGGYGLRLKAYDRDNTRFIIGFQHISVHPYSVRIGEERNKDVLDDWQFSFLLGHDFGLFAPYFGPRWESLDEIHWTGHERKLRKSSRYAGLIAGTDIKFGKRTWINLEGEFLDGIAAAVSLNFAF